MQKRVMALTCLVSLSILNFSLLLLVFVWEPLHANATGGTLIGRRYSSLELSSTSGICASAVVVHGYKCQEFEVTTEDGYILSLQRIPDSRINNESEKRSPVIIQHGILVDGITWLTNAPDQNLPFILADNGFDVWIANTLGTRFSKRHVSLDSSDPKYWDWSWDELVAYDLPAVFNFVYRQTGQKVDYVGHSLGTLVVLASLSEGKLVDKLNSAALLSPIAYLSHMTSPLAVVGAKSFAGEVSSLLGVVEFNPQGEAVAEFLKTLCSTPGVDCYDFLPALTGRNCCLNSSTIGFVLENEPQSTSTKTMVHLSQNYREGKVTKYNYERADYNVMHYGNIMPPIYNLSNIPHDIPLFISHGGEDTLSDTRDVQLLLEDLKFHNVDKLKVQHIKDYAHADFNMGVNAKDIVYNSIIDFFTKY